MNFRKLLTYLTVGTAAVIPFAGAQNPTILQGSYISNVFGNSNFVLNPNAQTNVANVTTVTATVARSTTTPLVATSEFTVAIGTANGTATWATRAFDAGMKNNNCEARFSYRGFAATSKVHIKQGANTVASLNLTPATDPRIASINFPCGDLSTATTFVVTDTAILAGTNEIGGIYVGLATNMANVAQAEVVVRAISNTSQTLTNGGTDILVFGNEILDTNNQYNNSTGVFTAAKAGTYLFNTRVVPTFMGLNAQLYMNYQKNNVVSGSTSLAQSPVAANYPANPPLQEVFTLNVGETVKIQAQLSGDSVNRALQSGYSDFTVTRFPSSSELVVTPERQNTFAGLLGYSGSATNAVTSSSWTKLTASTTLNRELFGKADTTASNDLSLTIKNLPVGTYEIKTSGALQAQANSAGDATFCNYGISDLSSPTNPLGATQVSSFGDASTTQPTFSGGAIVAIYKNTSVADRTFTLFAKRLAGSGNCSVITVQADRPISITITPLDQSSNSALYVQGPVLSAGTGTASAAGYQGEEVSGTSTAGTGNECAKVTVNPGQWILYGTAYADMTAIGPTPAFYYYDVEIDDASGNLSGVTGSFQRGYFNLTSGGVLLSTTRIVRTSAQKIYYLNCRNGTGTKTNNTSVFKAVRLN